MNRFIFNKEKMFNEFEGVFGNYPSNVDIILSVLDKRLEENNDADSFEKKSWIYEVAAEMCEIRLMPSCPFFFELDTGRDRNSITSTWPPEKGVGGWLISKGTDLLDEYNNGWLTHFAKADMVGGVMFADFSHHYAQAERVLEFGISGLRLMAEAKLSEVLERNDGDDRTVSFYRSMISGLNSLERIAKRFSIKAKEMLNTETDPVRRSHLSEIAAAAEKISYYPADTFYEALCTVTFIREMCNALDGIGFAVLGHLDRILGPYLENDLQKGSITPEEAQALIDSYLAITDARWDLNVDLPGGTNATVIIGGCDRAGKPVFNKVTEMILKSMSVHRFANPKIQARVEREHSSEYLNLISDLAKSGTNVLSVFNDEVVIDAQVRAGKKLEDARLYVAGGCQEPMLSNENNSRAYVYLNLAALMEASILPEKWEKIYRDAGEEIRLLKAYKARSFEEFYSMCIFNYATQMRILVNRYNHYALKWPEINPCPLYSALKEGCIEKEMDVTEGGAVYNSDSFGMVGIGTCVDSLYAIKTAVYDEGRITLKELIKVLENNFEGEERLRMYLKNRIAKMGSGADDVNALTGRFFNDISKHIAGYPNTRGGYFEASLFTFYAFEWFKNTMATANGRLKGEYLSRGGNPSEFVKGIDAASLLYNQQYIDYRSFAGGSVLYMDLPVTKGELGSQMFVSVIRSFIDDGGSIMDYNVIDRNELIEAQRDPQNHQNIVVRVCGYSALFHSLSREMQDEIINRTQR